MKFKTHPYIAYIAFGIAIGCVIACVAITLSAMQAGVGEVILIFGAWAFGLLITGALAGIVATYTWPTAVERRQIASHAMKPRSGPGTPNRPR